MEKEIEYLSSPINSNIFIRGIKHESQVNELFKALSLLCEAKDIINRNIPDYGQAEKDNTIEYYDIMFEIESKQSELILELNHTVCKLISIDLLNVYLK